VVDILAGLKKTAEVMRDEGCGSEGILNLILIRAPQNNKLGIKLFHTESGVSYQESL